jgi:hypothetical protein
MGAMGGSIIQSASAGLQAVVGNNAIDKANNAQINGQQNANNFMGQQYEKTQNYLSPYRSVGDTGTAGLQSQFSNGGQSFTMGDFNKDPGYQFRLQQGQQALDRASASKGLNLSGAALKSISDYNQGQASQEYQNAYNRFNTNQNNQFSRLSSMAGIGQNAANQSANYSNQYGTNMANGIGEIGNLQAAGTMAKYRNWQTQDSRAAGAWSGGGGDNSGQSAGGSSSGLGFSNLGSMFGGGSGGGQIENNGMYGNMGSANYWNTAGNTYTNRNGQVMNMGYGG